jgi:hypothetical protein
MKKTIEGYLYNRIEKLGEQEYNHIGFEDEKQVFGDMLATLVPKVGDQKKARLTIELLENDK